MSRQTGFVKKAWGYELIFATNDDYCGKILHFSKAKNKCSMHFHLKKDETWFVSKGKFECITIDTKTGKQQSRILNVGETHRNPPNLPHQLIALEDNSEIFEVSTADSVEDNYRVFPGDSQTDKKVFVNEPFDIFHVEYLALLEFAKQQGDFLIVALESDERINERKENTTKLVNTLEQRKKIIEAIRYVDQVKTFSTDQELEQFLREIQPDIYVTTSDSTEKQIIGSKFAKKLVFFERNS